MDDAEVAGHFPQVSEQGFRITSEVDFDYNCIAWAAGDTHRFWWPGVQGERRGPYYWPEGVPYIVTLEAFAQALATEGYEPCATGDLENGVEKAAIFAWPNGRPRHAARQLEDGTWTSKIGEDVDICHNSLEGMAGAAYGQPVMFLRRARPTAMRQGGLLIRGLVRLRSQVNRWFGR
jgi:hypothetical protein